MKRRVFFAGLLLPSMFHMNTSALPPQNVFSFGRLECTEQGNVYVNTNRGLFLKTNDSTPWREISPPDQQGLHVQNIALNALGDVIIKSGADIYFLNHNSTPWQPMPSVQGMGTPIAAGASFFAFGDNGGVWRAENGGWVRLNDGPWRDRPNTKSLAWIWCSLFLATDQGLLESLDKGRKWKQSTEPKSFVAIEKLLAAQDQWLYTSSRSSTPGQEHLPSLFVRNQQSGTWRRFASNPIVDHRAYKTELLAAYKSVAYVKLSSEKPRRDRWFRVQDAQSWSEINLPFAKDPDYVRQLLATQHHMYALMNSQIYRSMNKGDSWEIFADSTLPPFDP